MEFLKNFKFIRNRSIPIPGNEGLGEVLLEIPNILKEKVNGYFNSATVPSANIQSDCSQPLVQFLYLTCQPELAD